MKKKKEEQFEFDPAFPQDEEVEKKRWWKTALKIVGWILVGVVITLVGLYLYLNYAFSMLH